ncbi:MAG: segregation/condensation protein A [cyanobacterium endosymbiont of Rhopalodia musculus]|uniref:segregation/condensation protein A n=1 Tax=cyanobacterium endosymbiont of Epithemia clementina EcSB TaxID=3034674 RepID=UPI0024801624|nr:segregation/condensation protein A [cyanobacterium endosymbiont of Epithemia clementina EcSB]WGT68102.1 segregation/condensation protein A [cyanobacterium endosymbiont of Epithemia clementina EcSB]
MTTSLASKTIASLIDLAQQGDIDPWNVQVIDVIDRFLDESGMNHDLDLSYQQDNLPRSGQAFLWASMLVRFKADTLEKLESAQDQGEDDLNFDEITQNFFSRSLPVYFEQKLRRRTAAFPPSQRRVTLSELITHIEEIAEELDCPKPNSPRQRKRPRNASRQEATEIVTRLAHQENLTELAQQLEQFFHKQLSEFVQTQNWIKLEELLTCWHRIKSPNAPEVKRDRVGIFWALLLLCSQSKVELSQEEFYQDLKIQVLQS